MPNIETITIGGTDYNIVDNNSGYTSFDYSSTLETGVTIGVMNFNGITYTIYAPISEDTSTLSVAVNNDELRFLHVQLS